MKKRKLFQKMDGVLIAEIAVISIILLPVFIVSFYTLPSTDDYYNSVVIRTSLSHHRFYISAAISGTIYYWKNISGYFFGAFLNFYISPLLRGGIEALRITVFVLNFFFYVSLYFLVNELLEFFWCVRNIKIALLVYILVLFAFTNNEYNSEMISWYCTMIGYLFVVACSFWGIIYFLKAVQNNKLKYLIASSVLGFLASGGSLNITALNCGMYLIVAFAAVYMFQKKKIAFICFFSALAGAVVNVLAPGNYIRHGAGPYSVLEALSTASYYGKQQIQELVLYSPFVLLLCIFFVLMLKMIHNPRAIKGWHLVAFGWIIVAGIIMVNFPVCLGYIVDYFPDRCVWVQNCVIYLGSFSWIACLAEWIKRRFGDFEIRKDTMICIGICFIFYGCSLCSRRDISYYPTIDMIKQIVSGEIADFSDYWVDILEEIERSEEDGVTIYRKEIKTNDFIRRPDFISEENSETDERIAEYYEKDWIHIILEAE